MRTYSRCVVISAEDLTWSVIWKIIQDMIEPVCDGLANSVPVVAPAQKESPDALYDRGRNLEMTASDRITRRGTYSPPEYQAVCEVGPPGTKSVSWTSQPHDSGELQTRDRCQQK